MSERRATPNVGPAVGRRTFGAGWKNQPLWNALAFISRYKGEMLRAAWMAPAPFVLAGVLAGPALAVTSTPAAAPTAASPFRSLMGADAAGGNAARSRNAGSIEGVVTAVDYRKGIITLQSPGRGKLDVIVLPSTTFEGRNSDFQAISDVVRGTKIEILASQRADFYIAQVVRLK
jgi:hypothetical protein